MKSVIIIGPAGSGKSALTGALYEYLAASGQSVEIMNLDPGAIKVPYIPTIDIREYLTVDEIMEEYNLGPNGALIYAVDLIAEKNEFFEEIMALSESDLLLIDTPGQLELFVFREIGPFMIKKLPGEKALVFTIDPLLLKDISGVISIIFLATSAAVKLGIPHILAITKKDLLSKEEEEKVLSLLRREEIEKYIERESDSLMKLLNKELLERFWDFFAVKNYALLSSKKLDGIDILWGFLERLLNIA